MLKTKFLSALLFAGLSASAFAAEPAATGLGQSWPNSPDLSASANWHVYVFQLDGVSYVQVNQLSGQVYGAVAVANGHATVLPMGNPAEVAVETAAPASGETVYASDVVKVVAEPDSNGLMRLEVGPPCDPIECNTNIVSP